MQGEDDTLTNTVIALDVAFAVLCRTISRHDAPFAALLSAALRGAHDQAFDVFPLQQAGDIAGKLSEYRTMLDIGTTSPSGSESGHPP